MKNSESKHSVKTIIIICTALVLVAGIVTGGFFLFSKKGEDAGNSVYVSKISTLMQSSVSGGAASVFSGVVDPQKTVAVEKDSERSVKEIKISVGQEIHEGDILFTYESEEMEIKLLQAQLEQQNINSTIETLKNQISELQREKQSAPSSQQLSYTVQIQSCELEIKTQQLSLSEKEAEIKSVEKSLANCDVAATCSGSVKAINTTPGAVNQDGSPAPFIEIQLEGQYRVKASVSELHMGEIIQGMPCTVISRVDQSKSWQGTVSSVETETPSASQSMNNYYDGGTGQSTSKYTFYITLTAPEDLLLGQHVYVVPGENSALPENDGSIVLSEYYIVSENGSSYVWRMNEKSGKTAKCEITIGEYDSTNGTYKIESGLSKDDYIAYPDENIKAGLKCQKDDEPALGEAELNNADMENGMTDGLAAEEKG